uniref:Acetylcholinesterase n=1 Tax=Parastrongyloides trichosuri TaxID=131310 RepID=A0A0N4ZKW3_PARTI
MILFYLLLFFVLSVSGEKVVETKYGKLIGEESKRFPSVYEFLGVPFAKPPVGKLRFKEPQLLEKNAYSKKGLKANVLAKTCFHDRKPTGFRGFDEWDSENLTMSEDCLQLNMWVPKEPSNAVLVFIYGRGYHKGSPSTEFYNGKAFATRTNVTFITINYRLGVLGFGYYKGTKGKKTLIPGNMGLLDQQMALQWIDENIKFFGVKKPEITIMGHGAGASSATAHLFSEGSRKLFKRVIAASGTAKNRWAFERNNLVEDNFKELIKKLKCNKKNDKEILNCLQEQKPKELFKHSIVNPKQSVLVGPFLPVESDDVFLKGNIKDKMRDGKMKKGVDLLLGLEAADAAYFMPQFLSGPKYNCGFNKKLPTLDLANQCCMNETRYRNVLWLIAKDYKINNELFVNDLREIYDFAFNVAENKYRERAIKSLTDVVMHCEAIQFGKMFDRNAWGSRYIFMFNKRNSYNPWPRWMGTTHGYELLYFFGHPFVHPELYKENVLEDEKKFSHKTMKIIKKFVETGFLQDSWDEFSRDDMRGVVLNDNTMLSDLGEHKNMERGSCKKLKEALKIYGAKM